MMGRGGGGGELVVWGNRVKGHLFQGNIIIVICMALYTESVADQTDHFADVFDRENVAYSYDLVTTLWRSK